MESILVSAARTEDRPLFGHRRRVQDFAPSGRGDGIRLLGHNETGDEYGALLT